MSREEKRKEMNMLVEEWRESGMTQKDFSREHNIKLSRLRHAPYSNRCAALEDRITQKELSKLAIFVSFDNF